MHQPLTKKQEIRRQVLSYGLVPILVVVVTLLITFYVNGYRYNADNQAIEQGGMIQVQSRPTGATVTYDNEVLSSRTNMRIDALAGTHTVTLTRSDYRSWQKTVAVEPGRVLWLNYALLIPEEPTVTQVATYASVDDALVVSAEDQLLLLRDETQPVVTSVIPNGESTTESEATVPSELYATDDASLTFDMVSTDASGRYILIKASGVQTQWLVLDRNTPSASRSLSKIAGQDLSQAFFSNARTQDAYVVTTTGALRRVDFAERVMSAPLISGVEDVYQSSDGILSYIATDPSADGQLLAGYYTPGAETARVYQRHLAEDGSTVRFRIDRYDGNMYAVLQQDLRLDIMRLDLPRSDSDTAISSQPIETVAMQKHVDFISFSPTGRFVLTQDGADFTTYDIELGAITHATLQGDTSTKKRLQWLDDYHLWSDRDRMLAMYEFDGANVQVLGDIAPNLDVLLTENKRNIYYFQTADDGSVILERLKLS